MALLAKAAFFLLGALITAPGLAQSATMYMAVPQADRETWYMQAPSSGRFTSQTVWATLMIRARLQFDEDGRNISSIVAGAERTGTVDRLEVGARGIGGSRRPDHTGFLVVGTSPTCRYSVDGGAFAAMPATLEVDDAANDRQRFVVHCDFPANARGWRNLHARSGIPIGTRYRYIISRVTAPPFARNHKTDFRAHGTVTYTDGETATVSRDTAFRGNAIPNFEVHVIPRHGSASSSASLLAPRLHSRGNGAIPVTVRSSVSYQEEGLATHAVSLGITTQNVSVTLSGAGSPPLVRDISGSCRRNVDNLSGIDLERASCDATREFPVSDLPDGVYTVSIPAGGTGGREGRQRILVNNIPYRPAAGVDSWFPMGQDSAVVTLVTDTQPVVDGADVTFPKGIPVDWEPAVTGGNGEVRVEFDDPGIPGLAHRSGNRLVGIPTQPGRHAVTVTATDSDNIEFGDPDDETVAEVAINVAIQDAPVFAAADLTHAFALGTSVDWAPPPATGGSGPLRHRYSDPRIPGLSLDAESGRLSGVPSRVGDYAYRVAATDSASALDPLQADNTAAAEFLVRVVAAAGPTVSLAPGPRAGVEGDPLAVGFSVLPASQATLTVPYTLGADNDPGTADAGASDYSDAGAGSVVIAPGETRGTVRVDLSSDTEADGGEVFTVGLGVPTAQGSAAPALGSPATATVTVLEPLSLLVGAVRLTEGDAPVPVTLTVDLGSTVASDLPVTLALDPAGTAVPGTDFAMRLPSLTVSSGASVATAVAPVEALADGVSEPTEQIVLAATADGHGRGRNSMLIDDADPPGGTVRIRYSGHAAPLREGEDAHFEVALDGGAGPKVSVPWALAPDSSAHAPDVAVASGTVTFPANFADGGVRAIRVPVTDDALAEPGEVLRLRLGDPATPSDPGQAARLSVAQREAGVRIAESDPVTASLSGPDAVDEGGTAAHTVTFGGGERPGPFDLVVSVSAGGTGPDPVRVSPLARQVTFTVDAAEDPDSADGELTVGIRGDFPATALPYPVEFAPASVAMRVRDDEATTSVSFDRALYRVVEGGPDTVVTVRLGRGVGHALSIPVTLGNTPRGPLVFAPGETEQTLVLSSPADMVPEDPVTLLLGFGVLPAGVAPHTALTEAEVVYADRDIALSATPAMLTEGVGDQVVTVTAELEGPVRASDLPVSLWVGAPGSTAESSDFAVNANLSATIRAGARTATATFAVRNDGIAEPDERIVVSGSTAQQDAVAPVTVTVADTDTAELGIARSPGSPAPAEGGEATYDVSLGPVGAEVLVPWEVTPLLDGIGLDEVAPTAGTLTFAAGMSAGRSPQTISVRFPDDNLGELAEDVGFRLGAPSVPSHPGLAGRITVTTDRLAETLPASDTVALAVTGPTLLVEGERGAYRVHTAGAAVGSQDIDIVWGMLDGEATVNVDYANVSGEAFGFFFGPGVSGSPPQSYRQMLTAGATEEVVLIRTVDNNVGEGPETFRVTFEPGVNEALPVRFRPESPLTMTVTILDDDLTAEFDPARYEVPENSAPLPVTVRLSGPAGIPVTIPVVATPVDGATVGELLLTGTPVVFGPDDTVATFEVRSPNDRYVEAEEGFDLSLDLSSAPWLSLGTRPTAAVRITDGDRPRVNLGATLAMSGPLTFTVAEDASPGTPVGMTIEGGDLDIDHDPPRWSLGGADAALFDIAELGLVELDVWAAQLRLASGVTLDHETAPRLTLAVQIRDGSDAIGNQDSVVDDSLVVTVEVANVPEPPAAPEPPDVSAGLGMADGTVGVALSLGWTPPTGGAGAVAGYDVGYREAPAGGPGDTAWIPVPHAGTGVSASVSGLSPGAVYEARVRARNANGPGAWSGVARGGLAPGAVALRLAPGTPTAFSVDEGGGAHTLSLDVTLSGAQFLEADLPLSVAAVGRTATDGADFSVALPDGASIEAGNLSAAAEVTVTPSDDSTVEATETLALQLWAGDFAAAPLTVTIADDDTAALSLGSDAGALAEGDRAVFTVTLSDPVESEVRATLSVRVPGFGGLRGDIDITVATVTFAANGAAGATREVAVSVVDDAYSEPAETLHAWIAEHESAFPDRVTVGATDVSVRADIAESDPMTLEWSARAPSADEGGELVFVPRITGAANPARVHLQFRLGGTAIETDYTLPAEVTVGPSDPPGLLRATIPELTAELPLTLSLVADPDREPDKTVEFEVTEMETAHGRISPAVAGATATATIRGDLERIVLSASASLVAEGSGAAPLTVAASIASGNAAAGDVVLPLTLRRRGSAEADDHEIRGIGGAATALRTPPTVTIAGGSSSGSVAFTFEPADDSRVEGDETVVLWSRRAGYDVREATVVIEDNDTATLSVSAPADAVDESAGDARVVVRLDAEVDGEITYWLGTSAGSATGGGIDYSDGFRARHSISPNALGGATVRVPIVDDALSEDEETFTVSVVQVVAALQDRISVSEATVTIAASDPLRLGLGGPERVGEGAGFADYTVSVRRGVGSREATVGVRVAGESTAAAGDDFLAPVTPVHIPSGAGTVTVRVPVVDDATAEEDKTLVVELFDPSGGGGGPGGISLAAGFRVTTALADNDHPEVSVSFGESGPVTVAEGAALDVTVRLDTAPGRAVAVPVTVERLRGARGRDYGGVPATVTFGAAGREATLRVTATDDGDDDDGERILLAFGNLPGQVAAAAPDRLTVDIRDNDGRGPTVELSASPSRVSEGTERVVRVTARLAGSGVLDDDLAVALAPGTGSAGRSDHSVLPGLPTVTVAAGSRSGSATLTLSADDDDVVEPDEDVVLTASVAGFDTDAATVRIADSDTATVGIAGPAAAARESDGSVAFTLSLSRRVDADVSVSVTTADGTALAGSDYEASAGWHVFARGTPAGAGRTVTVRLLDDALAEPAETLTASVARVESALSASIRTGGAGTATAVINASDRLALSLSGPARVAEQSAVARYTVRVVEGRSASAVTVSVRAAPGSTATEGADHGAPPASLTLAAGVASATFDVAITDDADVDDGETLVVELFAPSGGGGGGIVLDPLASSVTTVIDDDELELEVTVPTTGLRVAEGETASVSVSVSGPPRQALTVLYSVGGDATAADRSDPSNGTLTVGAGETSGAVLFPVADDSVAELSEEFAVSLTSVGFAPASTDSASLSGPTVVTATIAASDALALSLAGADNAEIPEGHALDYRVIALGDPAAVDATVAVRVVGSAGATAGADYVAPAEVTVRPGAFSTPFSVRANRDAVTDPGEILTVSLGTAGAGGHPVLVHPVTLTATISERNAPPAFDSPLPAQITVSERARTGDPVGTPIAPTDPDGDTLTYSLSDARHLDENGGIRPVDHVRPRFGIDGAGQLTVDDFTHVDYENGIRFIIVTVTVSDGRNSQGGADPSADVTKPVRVSVTDAPEPPPAPGRPVVAAAATGGHRALSVSWERVRAAEIPPVRGYRVEHRPAGAPESAYSAAGVVPTGTEATIFGLEPGTRHEVRVRARNAEGSGEWSPPGAGSTQAGHTVSLPASAVAALEGAVATVSVAVDPPSPLGISVRYAVRAAGATAGADFTDPGAGALVIPPNAAAGLLEFPVADDPEAETTESFAVALGRVRQVNTLDDRSVLGSPAEVTVEIAPSDAVVLSVGGPARQDVAEGESSAHTLFVTGGNSPSALEVPLSLGGDATPGADFTAPGTVTIAAGASSARFTVSAAPDSERDAGETIRVAIGDVSTLATVLADPATVTATIVEPNAQPAFGVAPGVALSRAVRENSPAGSAVGQPVAATDPDGDTLSYSLEAPDRPGIAEPSRLFVVGDRGQVAVAAGARVDHEAVALHTVVVAVGDGRDARGLDDAAIDARATVRLSVTDLDEVPSAPPGVVVGPAPVGGHRALAVRWTAPGTAGIPPVTAHVVEHRARDAGGGVVHTLSVGAGASATIAGLDPDSAHEVRVRAVNDEGPGAWSPPRVGRTDPATVVSALAQALDATEGTTVSVSVGASPAPTVALTGAYSLRAAGATPGADFTDRGGGMFTIAANASVGVIPVGIEDDSAAVEPPEVFVVSLSSVTDGTADNRAALGDDTETSVTIAANGAIGLSLSADADLVRPGETVTLTASLSSAPSAQVRATLSLGGDAVAGDDYTAPAAVLAVAAGATVARADIAALSTAVLGRVIGIAVDDVAATDTVVPAARVVSLTIGMPNAQPTFARARATVTVREDVAPGDGAGSPIAASDGDGDPLTYSLVATDPMLFGAVADSGLLTVAAGATLDHETSATHTVTLLVRDGKDAIGAADTADDADIIVAVAVADVTEPPLAPRSLTVASAATDGHRALSVGWVAPAAGGRPATGGYDVEYRRTGVGEFHAVPHSGTGTEATIAGLLPGTAHEVRVRARNRDGSGPWTTGEGDTGAGFVVSMASPTLPVAEGDGSADVRVEVRPAAPAGGVAVTYAVAERGALNGVDYRTPTSPIVTVAAGATAATISVPIVDDDAQELAEAFVVALREVAEPGGKAVLGDDTETSVTIAASDAVVVDLSAPTTVSVGAAADAVVALSGETPGSDVTVTLATEGSAQAGADYTAFAGPVTVALPATGATVTIDVATTATPGREIRIGLSTSDTALRLGTATATVTVVSSNDPPTFVSLGPTVPFRVSEDAGPGETVGNPVRVVDSNTGDILVHRLSGGGGLFDVSVTEPGVYQMIVHDSPPPGAALDFEAVTVHTVTLEVGDGKNAIGAADNAHDISMSVEITVLDADEPPTAPSRLSAGPAPAGGDRALTVGWDAPDDTGIPPVGGYDIEIKPADADDSVYAADRVSHAGTDTVATISGLDPDTGYTVRVRARNDEGEGDWATTGATTRQSSNVPPAFAPGAAAAARLTVGELARPGTAVGEPLAATDDDLDPLTFSLSDGSGNFGVAGTSRGGRITVAAGATLDFESVTAHTMTVSVSDGKDAAGEADGSVDASLAVVVTVADAPEVPLAPAGLTLFAPSGARGAGLGVRWTPPDSSDRPPVTGYEVQHKRAGEDDSAFADARVTHSGTETVATVTGLATGTEHDVRVRARNVDGDGEWAYARGATGTGVDIDVDRNGTVSPQDALILFYTWQFGGILRADTGLRDLVFAGLLSRSGSPLTAAEAFGNAEELGEEYAELLDVDRSGTVSPQDALVLFYTWQFGGILRADTGLRDLVFAGLLSRSGSTLTAAEVFENAEQARR